MTDVHSQKAHSSTRVSRHRHKLKPPVEETVNVNLPAFVFVTIPTFAAETARVFDNTCPAARTTTVHLCELTTPSLTGVPI